MIGGKDHSISGGVETMSLERRELFSESVRAGTRTYFFDVKESSEGSKYLVISESRKLGDTKERSRVMVFEEDILSFAEGLRKAVDFMVKKPG
jgi:hypothetical protein